MGASLPGKLAVSSENQYSVSPMVSAARWAPSVLKNGLDPDAAEAAAGPYTFPNLLVDCVQQEPPGLVTGWWRGVGPTHNCFVVESFIDELAAALRASRSAIAGAVKDLGLARLHAGAEARG